MTRQSEIRQLLLLSFLAAGWASSAIGQVADLQSACDTPRGCIDALHSGLVALSLEESVTESNNRYEHLAPLITTTHDLPYIARFTVRRQWEDFSEEARERFVRSFITLSVMTYASRFVTLSEDTFRILGVTETGSGRVQVEASIARDQQPDIPIDYLLRQDEKGWRIVNVIADGVSDLALKRAEYQRVLAEGSVADLIKYVEDQIQAIEAPPV